MAALVVIYFKHSVPLKGMSVHECGCMSMCVHEYVWDDVVVTTAENFEECYTPFTMIFFSPRNRIPNCCLMFSCAVATHLRESK